jgi:prepilin-type processing-associated H-X9-DG protein
MSLRPLARRLSPLLAAVVLLAGSALAGPAAPPSTLPPGLVAAATRLADHDTVQSRFELSRQSILFADVEKQTGRMELRRADSRLLWLIDGGAQVLFADGRVYPAFKTRAEAGSEGSEGYSMPGGADFGSLLAGLVSLDADALARTFTATADGPDRWALVPRDQATAALFARCVLVLGGEPYAVRRVEVVEATGDSLTVEFPDLVVGAPLDAQRFATPQERSGAAVP